MVHGDADEPAAQRAQLGVEPAQPEVGALEHLLHHVVQVLPLHAEAQQVRGEDVAMVSPNDFEERSLWFQCHLTSTRNGGPCGLRVIASRNRRFMDCVRAFRFVTESAALFLSPQRK
jgi:hypothetical protein